MRLKHSGALSPLVVVIALATVSRGATATETYVLGTSEAEQIEKAAQAYNAGQADEGSRLVCRLEKQVGTRFKTKVCRTVATMEANERNARYFMRSKKPIIDNERVSTRN